MVLNPALSEDLAADVVQIYAEAERLMLERVAKSLAKGMDSPLWAERKLLELQFLKFQTNRLVRDLGNKAAAQVAVSLADAYNRGGAQAAADLASVLKVGLEEVAAPIAGLPAIEQLVGETVLNLRKANAGILRSVSDGYRRIVSETTAQVLLGSQTRLQATQNALDKFAKNGIKGFRDRLGRNWNLESYTEMAMRTATTRSTMKGYTERMTRYDEDLVIVSDAPAECPLCTPWERQVLSVTGSTAGYPTMDDARAAGLWHPNCRHSVTVYQEGITKTAQQRPPESDPERYQAKQDQRALERKVREAKRSQAVQITDSGKAEAGRKVRAAQKQLREHVAKHDLKRLYYRENLRTSTGPSAKAVKKVKPTPLSQIGGE